MMTASENITITITMAALYAAWDINMDGAVNVLDLTLVTQHFAETGTVSWIRQDVNGHGVLNALDRILIAQYWSA
jgi:hypothetical protein